VRLRRAFLAVAVAAGVVLVLALAGLYPREPLRRAAESRLRATFGPGASLRGVHVVPGGLRASLDGLTLDTPAFRLEVERVDVALRPGSLVGGGVHLRSLSARGASLRIKPADPRAPRADLRLPPVSVSSLDVPDAALRLELGDAGVVESRGIRAAGSIGSGTLSVEAPAITWTRDKTIDLGSASARLAADAALVTRLEQLRLAKGGSHVVASGQLGSPAAFQPNLRFEGPLRMADFAELLSLAGVTDARGETTLSGTVTSARDGIAVSLEARGRGIGAGDLVADQLDVTAEHKGGVSSAGLTARAFGGRIEAQGRSDGRRTEGRATLADVSLEALPASVNLPPELRGRVSGSVRWNGPVTGPIAVTSNLRSQATYRQPLVADVELGGTVDPRRKSVDLRITSSVETSDAPAQRSASLRFEGTAKGAWPPAVEGTGTIAAQALIGALPQALASQARVSVTGTGSSLQLTGSVLGGTFEGHARVAGAALSELRLTATGLDLQRLDARARGIGRLELQAAGPRDNPTLDARLQLAGTGYAGVVAGDALVGLRGTRKDARWSVSIPSLHVSGDGDVTSGALAGALRAEGSPLGVLAPLVPEQAGLEGTLTAEAQLHVPLEAPSTAALDARVTRLEARTARFGPVTAQPFSIGYAGGRVSVRDLRAEAPGASARADGVFALQGSELQGTMRLDVDLSAIEPRIEGAVGRIGAEIAASGVADRPRIAGTLSLAGVAFDRPGTPRLRIDDGTVRIADNVAQLEDLKAEMDGGTLVLSGRTPVAALLPRFRSDPARVAQDEAAQLSLRWDGFDVGALQERLLPTAENRLNARLTGSLALSGGLAGLEEIQALLASQAADVSVGELPGRLEAFEVRVTRGRAATDGIQVSTTGGTFRLAGSAGIASDEIDATAKGTLDLRVLSPFLTDTALTGSAEIDASVKGTRSAPDARGSFTVKDGTARFRVLTQAITDIRASVVLDRAQIRIEQVDAALGGGKLHASGTLALDGLTPGEADVEVRATDVALRFPEGLRSRIEAGLKLTGRPGAFRLAGSARAGRALYDRDFQTSGFLAAATLKESPLLRSIALDIQLSLASPLRVRNDTARLEATGEVALRGDLQSPSPFGRFEIVSPGGEVILLGARFAINRGTLSYDGSWDAKLDVEVQRRVNVRASASDLSTVPGEYTVVVAASGTVSEITREVLESVGGNLNEASETLRYSAEGPSDLDQSDLGYLALFGRRRSEMQGSGVAGEQAGALAAGQLARKLQRGLPFDNITITPELASRETSDQDARFTFGAALTDSVDLTYSLSLKTPEDKLIQLSARARRNVTALVRREYDLDDRTDVVTYGLGQRFEFGGDRARRTTPRRREETVVLTAVEVRGLADPALEKAARDAAKAEAGSRVTAWKIQDDGDRIRAALLKRGYIDVEVGAEVDGTVARFDVRAGRRYEARVAGMPDPPDLGDVLRTALHEEEALDQGRARLLEELSRRGYWRATVSGKAVDEGPLRVLAFSVEPGAASRLAGADFPGAAALGQDDLLKAAGGAETLLAAPQQSREKILEAYAAIQYHRAKVGAPRVIEAGGELRIEVPVEEGPQSLITQVLFAGSTRAETELRPLSRLQPGVPLDEEKALLSVDAIRDDYYRHGWARARVHASHVNGPDGTLLTFHVEEGRRLTVGEIRVAGLRSVRESFVRGAIDLKPGDAVDPARLGRIERRLLALSVFARVASRFSEDEPSVVTFDVAERARFGAGYDVRYNTDEKFAGVLDGEVRNLFGRGLGLGARYQGSSSIDKRRGTFFLPSWPWRGDLHASVFRELEEDFGEGDTGVTRLQKGFQVQQSLRFSHRISLLAGYSFTRTEVTSELLPFPSMQRVASLDLSVIRDTRDDVLDPRRGRFVSLNQTFAPSQIGSDQNFVKTLAQAFLTFPLGKRTTWAQGYRVGIAHVFDGEPLLSSEGFRAGGPNTIRGLPADALTGGLFGAQSLLIFNQELRVRSASGLGAALFWDAGQVFPTIKDMSFDLRHSIGVGLRYASPFGLLRLDFAVPLSPKEGEKRYQLFLSLGQAF
jgi:translocation and assembly module TamA